MNERRLIITVATGEYTQKVLQVTKSTMERYARKCNADFLALDEPSKFPLPHAAKFNIYPYLQNYGRTLFLDADVCVSKHTPNMFDIYPDTVVAMHDDTPYAQSYWNWKKEIQVIFGAVPKRFRLLNSGVVLTPSKYSLLWEPPKKVSGVWCGEQHILGYRISTNGIPYVPLSKQFNWQWWIYKKQKVTPDYQPYFIHAAGTQNHPHYKEIEGDRVRWLQNRKFEDLNNKPFLSLQPVIEPCTFLQGRSCTNKRVKTNRPNNEVSDNICLSCIHNTNKSEADREKIRGRKRIELPIVECSNRQEKIGLTECGRDLYKCLYHGRCTPHAKCTDTTLQACSKCKDVNKKPLVEDDYKLLNNL